MSVVKTQKSLLLESTEVIYNKKNDTIELISHDPDLKGKHFKITLSRGSETEDVLRQLLVQKEIIPANILPKFVSLPDNTEIIPPFFPVGVTATGEIRHLQLNDRHVFIKGGTFTGQTTFLRTLSEVISQKGEAYAVSLDTDNLHDLESSLEWLHQIYQTRKQKQEQGLSEDQMKPLYILVDAGKDAESLWEDHRFVEMITEVPSMNVHFVYVGAEFPSQYKTWFTTEGKLTRRGRMLVRSAPNGFLNLEVQTFAPKRPRDYKLQS